MAEAAGKAPKVEYRHNVAAGRHEIGVRSGKSFVSFATVDDAVFAQRIENAENVGDNNDNGEGETE
jgi:hypothetical protein